MSDLISREALLEQLRHEARECSEHAPAGEANELLAVVERAIELATNAPAITPQVVCNISGGILQGASADYPVNIYALDFDVDSFDEDTTGIVVEGSNAYLSHESAKVDPDFVREVIEAEEIYFHNGEPVGDE